MLIKQGVLEQIRAGAVTLAFRRWSRPTVKAGGRLRTSVGILAIDGVDEIARTDITAQDAARAGASSLKALLADLDGRQEGTLYRIELRWLGADPREAVRHDDDLAGEALEKLRKQLSDLDRRSKSGPWARRTFELIGAKDGITAAEIADCQEMAKSALKIKVRKLKELGLTESLSSGYRLSPRGRALMKVIKGRT